MNKPGNFEGMPRLEYVLTPSRIKLLDAIKKEGNYPTNASALDWGLTAIDWMLMSERAGFEVCRTKGSQIERIIIHRDHSGESAMVPIEDLPHFIQNILNSTRAVPDPKGVQKIDPEKPENRVNSKLDEIRFHIDEITRIMNSK